MESFNLNNRRAPPNSPQKQLQEQLPREASQQVLQQLPSLPAGSAEAQAVYSQHASKAWNGDKESQQQSMAWQAQQAQHTGPVLCTHSNGEKLY